MIKRKHTIHQLSVLHLKHTHLRHGSGMYDGTLGVIGAIEALAALKASVSPPRGPWGSLYLEPLVTSEGAEPRRM